jgi:small subunit ribosomal protein S20
MPHHKSAAKRIRTSGVARARNVAARGRMRTAIKAVLAATTRAEATTAYRAATSVLDRTAARGVIKKETANRRKARLALHTQKLPA